MTKLNYAVMGVFFFCSVSAQIQNSSFERMTDGLPNEWNIKKSDSYEGKAILIGPRTASSYEMDRNGKVYYSKIDPDIRIDSQEGKDMDIETAKTWILN